MGTFVAAVEGFLRDETKAWAAANGAEIIWLAPGDRESYWRMLAAAWTLPGDLVIVEHDMVPGAGVTDHMQACPRPWCSSPYTISRPGWWLKDGLGCTRFAERLKTRHPDLMERLGQVTGDGLPPRDWHRLDTRLSRLLRDTGYRPHAHRRSVHLHQYR